MLHTFVCLLTKLSAHFDKPINTDQLVAHTQTSHTYIPRQVVTKHGS